MCANAVMHGASGAAPWVDMAGSRTQSESRQWKDTGRRLCEFLKAHDLKALNAHSCARSRSWTHLGP
eukprot:2722946-Pyramimonas_sp.AAC.1